jgi:hypothetical protein
MTWSSLLIQIDAVPRAGLMVICSVHGVTRITLAR